MSINPAEDLLAVALHPSDGRGVAFVPFHDGRLGSPTYLRFPGVPANTRLWHLSWHPSGRFVGAALCDAGQAAFARVRRDETVMLEAHGAPVTVGKYPFQVAWTPDGRYALTNNLHWGPDVEGFWTAAPRGTLTSVRFDEAGGTHRLVGEAETGVSPEGLTISPDGRTIVTTNLERSFVPDGDARKTWHSSLSLLTLDPAGGSLRHVDDFAFSGVLPESAVFDRSGRYVAVTNFDHFDDSPHSGSIDFWRVDRDPLSSRPPLLVQTRNSGSSQLRV